MFWNDCRDTTHKTRLAIGFSNPESWKKASAIFDEHTLKICGHPVMEDWEVPYMKELAKIATSKGGVILEVGFGMGIAASFIQQADITNHIIVEANHEVAERARLFSKTANSTVEIKEGLWEEVIDQIPNNSVDGILFDTYPLSESEIHQNHFSFFKSAFKKLKIGGILTYYSDEIKSYHSNHWQKLIEAGFSKNNIKSKIIDVNPPADCQYWYSKTILAPIVIK
ncbi:MAG: class I SAM-dependent methyltransferase [bacterium]|nr:class I SAM-dependent methyltransferase [bacterium]